MSSGGLVFGADQPFSINRAPLGLVLNCTSAISFEEPPGSNRLIPPTTLLLATFPAGITVKAT